MSLVKKLKDILFEEEEYTDTIKVVPDNKRDEVAKNLAKEEELMKEEVKITEQKQYNNFNNISYFLCNWLCKSTNFKL